MTLYEITAVVPGIGKVKHLIKGVSREAAWTRYLRAWAFTTPIHEATRVVRTGEAQV